jgi:hypothetical protein
MEANSKTALSKIPIHCNNQEKFDCCFFIEAIKKREEKVLNPFHNIN